MAASHGIVSSRLGASSRYPTMLCPISRLQVWPLRPHGSGRVDDQFLEDSSILAKKGSPPTTLSNPDEKVPLPLIEKAVLNHNTRIFRFGLPSEKHILGIAPGQHVSVRAKINGKLVIRFYTPISDCTQPGYVELIVKVYRARTHPAYPEGGKMSQYLDQLEIGDTVEFSGPSGGLHYKGAGTFHYKKDRRERKFKTVSMIAGGTGLTPVYQLICTILRNTSDLTRIRLLFANTEEKDIICRKELDELAAASDGRFAVRYILSRPGDNWTGLRGRISEDGIKEHLFSPSEDNVVLLCGPLPMVNEACKPALEKLGHTTQNIHVF